MIWFSSSLYFPLSFIFIFIFTMSINSIVPINPSRISISQISYPPPTLTKPHIWYSNTADLFVTICGVLFGLHRAYFNHLQYFQTIMDNIKPGQLMPQGNVPLYPIPFNDLNPLLFHQFLQFFYHTSKFCGTKWDWGDIQDISINWYLHQQTAIATWKLVDICWHPFPYPKAHVTRVHQLSHSKLTTMKMVTTLPWHWFFWWLWWRCIYWGQLILVRE